MDDSVIEVREDISIIELDSTLEDKENRGTGDDVFPSKSSRRKQTKGGIKLDDTIELDSTSEDVKSERKGREVGDGCSDSESEPDTTERENSTLNPSTSAYRTPGPEFKSMITSTPSVENHHTVPAKMEQVFENGNTTCEHNDTARIGDIQDEMYNSFEDKKDQANQKEASSTAQAEGTESSSTEGQDGVVTDDEFSEDENCASSSHSYHHMTLPSKKNRVLNPEKLPETCTLLTADNGGKVYLVGTAHFSHESQQDVTKVIQAVQPDIVLLELCKDRANILQMDEKSLLEHANGLTLERIIATIRQEGTVQGIMNLMLLSMSIHLTKELGMAPGGEFRSAYKEAHNIPGCLVHLGDRPIHITLKRALGSLSLWQKIKLGFNVLTSKESVSKEEVERCKQKDILESLLEELSGEFPPLSRVFVEERDIYLAHSLRVAVEGPWRVTPQDNQGPSEAPVVVGVVGIMHVQGIVKRWSTVKSEDVVRVVRIPTQSRTERWAKTAIKSAFVLVSLYGGYRILRNPIHRLSSLISNAKTLNFKR